MSIYYASLFAPDPDSQPYAWRISRDHLADGPDDPYNGAGTVGPSDAPDDLCALLEHPITNQDKVMAFRILDDDGELYYSGHLAAYNEPSSDDPRGLVTNPYKLDERAAFGPLTDYGTPNAGATEIQYRNPTSGEWETM